MPCNPAVHNVLTSSFRLMDQKVGQKLSQTTGLNLVSHIVYLKLNLPTGASVDIYRRYTIMFTLE